VLLASLVSVALAQAPSPPPLPPCGSPYNLSLAVDPFCPNQAPGTNVPTPSPLTGGSIACSKQPGSANGGMVMDVTNIASSTIPSTIQLSSVQILLPFQNTTAVSGSGWTGSAPLSVWYRRVGSNCVAGTVCTGSVRDGQFNVDGTLVAGAGQQVRAAGSPTGNILDSSWTQVVTNFIVSGNYTLSAVVPFSAPIPLGPGSVLGFWIRFMDGQSMTRETDSSLNGLGSSSSPTPNFNAPGDPTFSYIQQGYLRLSAAMQMSNSTTPNWGNMRPFVSNWGYTASCTADPPSSPPPPPLLSPPPLSPPTSPPPNPPLPACGSANVLNLTIPSGCPGGPAGSTLATIACPAQPSTASGGMLLVRLPLAGLGKRLTLIAGRDQLWPLPRLREQHLHPRAARC
jgi:hypothetical protein